MATAIEELTPLIGRLFYLKVDYLDGFDLKEGDILLFTSIDRFSKKFPLLSKKDKDKVFNSKIWAQYPQAILCQMLHGEKERLFAFPYTVYFYDYFELIEAV